MKTIHLVLILLSSLLTDFSLAATTNVGLLNSVGSELLNIDGIPLTAGIQNIDGDGTILQVGYYTMATSLNPFLGEWVAMTGPGTPYVTTVGDGGRLAGRFKTISLLEAGTFSFVEPAAGTPLTLRFYDSTTISSSTYFNAVSTTSGSFNWVAPSTPQSGTGLALPAADAVWQAGAGSAFRTTIPIPEPSSVAILVLGMGALAMRRRTSGHRCATPRQGCNPEEAS
jgi:PEP-CTERM motif